MNDVEVKGAVLRSVHKLAAPNHLSLETAAAALFHSLSNSSRSLNIKA